LILQNFKPEARNQKFETSYVQNSNDQKRKSSLNIRNSGFLTPAFRVASGGRPKTGRCFRIQSAFKEAMPLDCIIKAPAKFSNQKAGQLTQVKISYIIKDRLKPFLYVYIP